jgi:hypothetical protein
MVTTDRQLRSILLTGLAAFAGLAFNFMDDECIRIACSGACSSGERH